MKLLHTAQTNFTYSDYKRIDHLYNGWSLWFVMAFSAVFIVYFTIDLIVTRTYFPLLVMLIGVGIIAACLTVRLLLLRAAYRKSPLSNEPLVVTDFYEDRLEQHSAEGAIAAEYALLYGIIETCCDYCFMVTKKQFIVVAKRDCSTQLTGHIAALIQKRRMAEKTDSKWLARKLSGAVLGSVLALGVALILGFGAACFNAPPYKDMVRKPVIYLYPEERTDITVTFDIDGELICTYPEYNGGWNVTALPDGTLYDESGREYDSLFWEATSDIEFDFSEGFCVKGDDTVEFLQWALEEQGLTQRESNDFILYWLPYMQDNEYNVIAFQNESYTDIARLYITPQPDHIKRVFMAYYSADKYVNIPSQELRGFERDGFTVVEWGGAVTE